MAEIKTKDMRESASQQKIGPQALRAYFRLEDQLENEDDAGGASYWLAIFGRDPGTLGITPFNINNYKRELIADMLYSIKNYDSDAEVNMDGDDLLHMVEGARKLGAKWPELDIIEKSLRSDLRESEEPQMEVSEDGTRAWYLNGQLHRTDGPAIERADGTRAWYLNGQRHRTDGPAIERADGTRAWYLNGQRHRTDGPAVEYADGYREWFLDGQRHRTDGPAVEDADGTRVWYINGQRHRTDGPAIERADGTRAWYLNGQRHRTDGPAVEYADGGRDWWLNGAAMPFPEWLRQTKSKLNKPTIMRFLLLMIKQGNNRGAAECMEELAQQGFDYPEFEVIQRSIRSEVNK